MHRVYVLKTNILFSPYGYLHSRASMCRYLYAYTHIIKLFSYVSQVSLCGRARSIKLSVKHGNNEKNSYISLYLPKNDIPTKVNFPYNN